MTTATVNPYSAPNAMGAPDQETYQPQIFSFDGRIGRLRYLAYGLAWNFAIVGCGLAVGGLLMLIGGTESALAGVGAMIMVLAYFGTLVPTFVLAVRRLNDMDASGWLSLLMIVPFVNFIMGLVLIFAPGTPIENKYGPAPEQNSTGVVIAALVFPIIGVIGILAAVALPAYQDYTLRAQAAQEQQL